MISPKNKSLMILIVSCAIALFAATTNAQAADPVRVLVWDEQQPEQIRAYGEKFLGETIAAHLESRPGLSVRTARLDDADQGLDDSRLEAAEVLVFWCHRRSRELDDKRAEAVVQRVLAGKLGLIVLHSAHWAKPFILGRVTRLTPSTNKRNRCA